MNETYKVRSIGGALVVTIPRHVIKQIPVEAGDEVAIGVRKVKGSRGLIVIEPLPKPKKER